MTALRKMSDPHEMTANSPKTVSVYRARVLEKLRLGSNSDLTYYALKNGLIQ